MDAELVVRFQRGEETAFEDLVRRHMRDAFGFCLRLTGDPAGAEELSQDGFVLAYRHLREFRGESSFQTWLYRILLNLHRDGVRRRSREAARLDRLREDAKASETSGAPDAEPRAAELDEVIRRHVAGLPDRQREVLVLHVYQGLDYRAIADALGCTYEDVKVNLSLARRRLKEELKERLE
ncbi:MAG TPA: sigma-70 family RNA polymerase sigma factor [Planctomycetota bacterium]|nr:sigma-70 family RNA polymerase sigma factor [Planctomycetota bacterium]